VLNAEQELFESIKHTEVQVIEEVPEGGGKRCDNYLSPKVLDIAAG